MKSLPLALAALLLVPAALPAQDAQEKVDRILDRVEESRGAELWEAIRDLEGLGRGSIEAVRKGLTRADAYARIAAAKALYAHEQRDEALEALGKVVGGKNAPARRVAADMIGSLAAADSGLADKDRRKIAGDLERQAGEAQDPVAQVALWRSSWLLTQGIRPVREIRDLYARTENRGAKEEAALVLAEMDRFTDARPTLLELAEQPGERGRMARAYKKLYELTEELRRKAGDAAPSKYDFRQIEEAIDVLKANYHDEAKIDPKKLVEAAVRGACASLDPYTTYMDPQSIDELRKEALGGEYGGIGARVSLRKDKAGRNWLTIEEPIFSGPAYRHGLRSGDTIVDVEGETTVNRELSDLVRRLRGKPGTPVKIKVLRRGWTKEKDYEITREQIRLETTTHRMMPGGIGYIKLSTFGEQDIALVEQSLKDMGGMKALVFDLRGNTGGYLRTAQRIASYFLDKGTLIVTTRGRGVVQDTRRSDGQKITDVPVVMLIDGGSASASEILAGALQDHKRAVLVGEKSFGKGSVQDLKPLKTTDDKAAIKVTISKWFLPSGKSVETDKPEESGVHPDVKVTPPERDFWKDAEFERLRAQDDILNYVKKIENEGLFKKISETDNGDLSIYPGFDALYASLNTKASKEEVRELVREYIRKRYQDEYLKHPLYYDLQTDVVLQRGILEVCKLAKIDAKSVQEFTLFARAPQAGAERAEK
ncbi:MAG TPA: S41 family peptidase [Planctomycetota bacterium]|nr:S41 family peptidase [Planctomycetota bacterium]